MTALQTVEQFAVEVGVADRPHLWPDKSLGSVGVANRMPKPRDYLRWLRKIVVAHQRVAEMIGATCALSAPVKSVYTTPILQMHT